MEFQDDGPGISPENLERVFIPFFTTKDAGTGLGLALVHKIIVHHDGAIRVECAPGQGATFVVTLPLVHS
jgi:signal transduction histidine kinase